MLMSLLVTAVALGARAHFATQTGFAGPHRPAHWAGQQEHTGATVPAAGAAVLDSKGSHPVVGLARGRQGAQECILVMCCPAFGDNGLYTQRMQAHYTLCVQACLYLCMHIATHHIALCCCTLLQATFTMVATQAMHHA